ncbi:MAG: methyltransferase family protein, partial [Candidatus Hinthialibacter sp.]
VRIQTDRGHVVVQDGPYAYIRHPGYASAIFLMISLAFCLGSLYALIPAAGVLAAIIVRTSLEDAVLHNELPGYKEYAEKVRWKLLRGIW